MLEYLSKKSSGSRNWLEAKEQWVVKLVFPECVHVTRTEGNATHFFTNKTYLVSTPAREIAYLVLVQNIHLYFDQEREVILLLFLNFCSLEACYREIQRRVLNRY